MNQGLALSLRTAKGPARVLDLRIAVQIDWVPGREVWNGRTLRQAQAYAPNDVAGICRCWSVPEFTRSLEAAHSLRLPGWAWSVGDYPRNEVEGGPSAVVTRYKSTDPEYGWHDHVHVFAATPALALCLAWVWARA